MALQVHTEGVDSGDRLSETMELSCPVVDMLSMELPFSFVDMSSTDLPCSLADVLSMKLGRSVVHMLSGELSNSDIDILAMVVDFLCCWRRDGDEMMKNSQGFTARHYFKQRYVFHGCQARRGHK